MNILLVGGGSGGHITPVLAVADALKKKQPSVTLIYAIGRGDKLVDLPSNHPAISRVVQVRAGKFRRYHGEGLKQLLDVPTVLKNIRDFFYVMLGFMQSIFLLGRVKPDVIFIKGGFVGVPIGLAAAVRGIPFITHDSDVLPGLANRIIARWAKVHAVAQPKDLYGYPSEKTVTVGVPVGAQYRPVSTKQQKEWRAELGLPVTCSVLLITGGGNGSSLINQAVTDIAKHLLERYPNLWILHVAGRGKLAEVDEAYTALGPLSSRVKTYDFVTEFHRYSGASTVVVTRAGANSLADFAAQERVCVVVPNPKLTGGHQLKNAEALERQGAITVVQESALLQDTQLLKSTVEDLLDHPAKRQRLARKLHALSINDAAERLAALLLDNVRQKG